MAGVHVGLQRRRRRGAGGQRGGAHARAGHPVRQERHEHIRLLPSTSLHISTYRPPQPNPTPPPRHETVIGVAAGDSHSLVCTLEGHVYGWGCYKDREGKMFFNATSEREVRGCWGCGCWGCGGGGWGFCRQGGTDCFDRRGSFPCSCRCFRGRLARLI